MTAVTILRCLLISTQLSSDNPESLPDDVSPTQLRITSKGTSPLSVPSLCTQLALPSWDLPSLTNLEHMPVTLYCDVVNSDSWERIKALVTNQPNKQTKSYSESIVLLLLPSLATCIWYGEPQYRISGQFALSFIIFLRCNYHPSSFSPFPVAYCLYLIRRASVLDIWSVMFPCKHCPEQFTALSARGLTQHHRKCQAFLNYEAQANRCRKTTVASKKVKRTKLKLEDRKARLGSAAAGVSFFWIVDKYHD